MMIRSDLFTLSAKQSQRQAAEVLTARCLVPDWPIARRIHFVTATKQTQGKLDRL